MRAIFQKKCKKKKKKKKKKQKNFKKEKKGAKMFQKFGQKCTKFENSLKKGRQLRTIIARYKLLEWALEVSEFNLI